MYTNMLLSITRHLRRVLLLIGMLMLFVSLPHQTFARQPGNHLRITEVHLHQPIPGHLTIRGDDLDFGNALTVTLGILGALSVVSETATEIIVELPADLTGGDYLLTVSRGEGQSQNDEYDLTVAVAMETPAPLSCPDGYSVVNDQYCIETELNPETPALWTEANAVCISGNARLCTAAEWIYACQNASELGLSHFPIRDLFQWVGDFTFGGELFPLRFGARIDGTPDCVSGIPGPLATGAPLDFRCCSNR